MAPLRILPFFDSIIELADDQREALGFLPQAAFRDAIDRQRVIAMLAHIGDKSELAGYVIFSGVFPHAKIQQIATVRIHRRHGIASALINEVVSQLEQREFLSISAAVAADLSIAQAFYESKGFHLQRIYPGGKSRKREIALRTRMLSTPTLLTALEADEGLNIATPQQRNTTAPLYVIDLNVLFDAIRDRERTPLARTLIGAALSHEVRLAVATEFLKELERQKIMIEPDPVLALSKNLPRLPKADEIEVQTLCTKIHNAVFISPPRKGAATKQAFSDARHLAEAVLAHASGFITSDRAILKARNDLFKLFGIDVADLNEFVSLLSTEPEEKTGQRLRGTNCVTKPIDLKISRRYLESQEVPSRILDDFFSTSDIDGRWAAWSIQENEEIVAVAASIFSMGIHGSARLLVHVRPGHVAIELFADYLLRTSIQQTCKSAPALLELVDIPGQFIVRQAAVTCGFAKKKNDHVLSKIAVGKPMTTRQWPVIAEQIRRKTGISISSSMPAGKIIEINRSDGSSAKIPLEALEDAFSPTLIIWQDRDGVIAPIAKSFADDLLGTTDQIALFGNPEATFMTRRTYFNTPRSAPLMKAGTPILFYESQRTGGRSAIVAVGRIVDATVVPKSQVSTSLMKQSVIDDVGPFSASAEVLATTFDNVLRLPFPVHLDSLRKLKAVGASNLQTPTLIEAEKVASILDMGWKNV
ncbi:GNAT family N-acetyltransferase [Dongia sp.]|uniref:GNAT family N-acetyltransferase n=1 Tax=Dongia sp. TaxID=1977262 RepID=UPI0035AF0FE5